MDQASTGVNKPALLQPQTFTLIKFVSPDDEHDMLETCKELYINKYIEKNLCVKLDNCQESLHDKTTKR